jgi:hypothetical protein
MERLQSAGVEFEFPEPYDSGVCHMAFFFDPDGNALALHRRYAAPISRRRASSSKARPSIRASATWRSSRTRTETH